MYCKQRSETFDHFNRDEYMHLISTYMNEYEHLDDRQNILDTKMRKRSNNRILKI